MIYSCGVLIHVTSVFLEDGGLQRALAGMGSRGTTHDDANDVIDP